MDKNIFTRYTPYSAKAPPKQIDKYPSSVPEIFYTHNRISRIQKDDRPKR